jgi:DNA-binding CsgD family transcriptional regulator
VCVAAGQFAILRIRGCPRTPADEDSLITRSDLHATLDLLGAVTESSRNVASYASAGVLLLPRLVASEMTTLSVCDLKSGRRHVFADPATRIGAADRASFDRHFADHPLVRYHADARGGGAHRISDSIPFAHFRESELFSDYYRRIGIDHVVALPIFVDDRTLVSFVLNRRRRDFSDRERDVLDLAGPTLRGLYRAFARRGDGPALSGPGLSLTKREREVLQWLSAGKTDRDIAVIVGCSHRTVQKHLQRAYEKLGVENRTAAAMRWLGRSPPP